MSVLIKGMEMPKDGAYWCEIGVAGEIATITIHGEDRKWFPLVPIPSHGSLIDVDKLIENAGAFRKDNIDTLADEWYVRLRDIEDAPTIIEAEGDE